MSKRRKKSRASYDWKPAFEASSRRRRIAESKARAARAVRQRVRKCCRLIRRMVDYLNQRLEMAHGPQTFFCPRCEQHLKEKLIRVEPLRVGLRVQHELPVCDAFAAGGFASISALQPSEDWAATLFDGSYMIDQALKSFTP